MHVHKMTDYTTTIWERKYFPWLYSTSTRIIYCSTVYYTLGLDRSPPLYHFELFPEFLATFADYLRGACSYPEVDLRRQPVMIISFLK